MFAGILGCGAYTTNTPTTPPVRPVATIKLIPAGEAGDTNSSAFPNPPASEPVPSSDLRTDTGLATTPTQAALIAGQSSIGTEVGKTLPEFEITLFDGTKTSTTRLSSLDRPIFLFFFTTW